MAIVSATVKDEIKAALIKEADDKGVSASMLLRDILTKIYGKRKRSVKRTNTV